MKIGLNWILLTIHTCFIYVNNNVYIGESGNEWANLWFLIFVIFSNNCFGSESVLY